MMLAPEGDTCACGQSPSVLVTSDAAVLFWAEPGGRVAGLVRATTGVAAAVSKAAMVSFWMNRFRVFSRVITPVLSGKSHSSGTTCRARIRANRRARSRDPVKYRQTLATWRLARDDLRG